MGDYIDSCIQCHYVPCYRILSILPNVWQDTYFAHRCRVWCDDTGHHTCQSPELCRKLKAHLKWAYKVARENSDWEPARHKQYYDQKFKCMKIVPGDLVLVRVKAFGPNHKIADRWEQVPYRVLSQHNNSPVYKVQPINENTEGNVRTLHYNQSGRMKLLAGMMH